MPDRSEIWDWAARHIDFGSAEAFKGHYNIENVPWNREPMRAFKNPFVREITVIGPPQESGKTITAQVCAAWRIVNLPAKMAFNAVTNVKADNFSDTRWQQTMHSCRALRERFSDDRHKTKKRRIIFRDGTFLIIQGAELEANRNSDSIEVQINDEVHLWDRPWHKEMANRTRAYRKSRKILNISTGGTKGSELEEAYIAGHQAEWSHHCPACGGVFQYVFNPKSPKCNIKFDLSKAIIHADGRLDLSEFEKSVHVACPNPACNHPMYWSEELLARLNRNGVYVPMNPNANPEKLSFHVNAFAIGARPWFQILEPWVRMNLRGGLFTLEILKDFITKELVEFWENKPMTVNKELRLGGYTRQEMLKPGGWKDEWIRVIAFDNQQGARGDIPHRWFVCRAFAKDGRSRLVDCGRLNEWEDCRAKQRELGVPDWAANRPGPWAVCDRAHDPTAVDDVCSRFKWFGMLGQDTEEFLHSPKSENSGQRMLFSEERFIDIGYGTETGGREYAVYFLWASQKVQDLLAALREGKAQDWELPRDIMDWCPEYADHINAHRQKLVTDNKTGKERLIWAQVGGWPDHLYDCESMLVVLGLMAGIFKRDES